MAHTPEKSVSSRAWYSASIADFLAVTDNEILGALTRHSEFSVDETQAQAWLEEIRFLKAHLRGLAGTIYFEFHVPRMGNRIDVVLVIGAVVFVIEFKVGEKMFARSAVEQVWDYALDLKNFHEGSHQVAIVPILIATAANDSGTSVPSCDQDRVYRPIKVNPLEFRKTLDAVVGQISGPALAATTWENAPYKPTPTIVEAARALYAHHQVEALNCFDAGRQNLGRTAKRIEAIIDEARTKKKKAICFVTGVPGAGKTLVGLNTATQHRREGEPTHAVLLSGNAPLVAVLRAALTRDEKARLKAAGKKRPKGSDPVKQFIQNVHHFRDEAGKHDGPPADHVVVFDEAQRAWNQAKTADFMKRKKGRPDFQHSESEYLLSYVDRHQDWAVVVCLVGGGQEIHTGEAGIGAWLDAVNRSFSHWEMHISSKLTDSEYSATGIIDAVRESARVHFSDELHLAVSMRSFRAEHVSAFVKALLDCEQDIARLALARLKRYPIAVTRNLALAKSWVRQRARGSERYGLIASSRAQRLKPHAIDVRVKTDPVHWFLDGKDDTRSSYYLEDAATEFQVQGLEVDWAIVSWDGDFRFKIPDWSYHDFRGAKWQNVKKPDNRNYLKNAYRVLLTRARQGMVIFVPEGDSADPTCAPEYYDATFQYLRDVGVPVLDS
ncbi:MAG: DUF2075 domain-containing protein [Candidatus Didemnitutus sp.]|nr:DUF2075 domain-containing protein [Candidatus Didemnitutus sp.]